MNLSKLTVSPANIIGRIVVAVALAPPASAALAEQGNDIVTTRADQDIDQPCYTHVTPSASTQVGLFTVHQRCGHVLYEIPSAMLDRVMLISTEFAALKSREGDTQTAGRFAAELDLHRG